eukprot:TRINITY_DN68140_c5_g3_i4.p1 TRINITY_DN68140_c5_g3~~TRINITY_DN68140_c5_g3_i4.p1  ORF type:complete len:378 (-),score=21.44 TRINITY_DN68140_c5_g3_i4:312-1445(-)
MNPTTAPESASCPAFMGPLPSRHSSHLILDIDNTHPTKPTHPQNTNKARNICLLVAATVLGIALACTLGTTLGAQLFETESEDSSTVIVVGVQYEPPETSRPDTSGIALGTVTTQTLTTETHTTVTKKDHLVVESSSIRSITTQKSVSEHPTTASAALGNDDNDEPESPDATTVSGSSMFGLPLFVAEEQVTQFNGAVSLGSLSAKKGTAVFSSLCETSTRLQTTFAVTLPMQPGNKATLYLTIAKKLCLTTDKNTKVILGSIKDGLPLWNEHFVDLLLIHTPNGEDRNAWELTVSTKPLDLAKVTLALTELETSPTVDRDNRDDRDELSSSLRESNSANSVNVNNNKNVKITGYTQQTEKVLPRIRDATLQATHQV